MLYLFYCSIYFLFILYFSFSDTYIDTQNLDWKDKTVELVGKHYKNSNFQNAGEAKLRELESQGDIFGNSEGTIIKKKFYKSIFL